VVCFNSNLPRYRDAAAERPRKWSGGRVLHSRPRATADASHSRLSAPACRRSWGPLPGCEGRPGRQVRQPDCRLDDKMAVALKFMPLKATGPRSGAFNGSMAVTAGSG